MGFILLITSIVFRQSVLLLRNFLVGIIMLLKTSNASRTWYGSSMHEQVLFPGITSLGAMKDLGLC